MIPFVKQTQSYAQMIMPLVKIRWYASKPHATKIPPKHQMNKNGNVRRTYVKMIKPKNGQLFVSKNHSV